MKRWYIDIAIFLGALIIGIYFSRGIYKETMDRALNNFSSQLNGITYKQDSIVSSVKTLQLSIKEVKEAFPTLKNDLKTELNVKLKNAVLIATTETEHNKTFETFVKDSVRIKDKIAEVADYSDEWVKFHYSRIIPGNVASVQYWTKDSCFAAIEREPWKLFHPFKRRDFFLKMKNYNPNNKIVYNQVIQVRD